MFSSANEMVDKHFHMLMERCPSGNAYGKREAPYIIIPKIKWIAGEIQISKNKGDKMAKNSHLLGERKEVLQNKQRGFPNKINGEI